MRGRVNGIPVESMIVDVPDDAIGPYRKSARAVALTYSHGIKLSIHGGEAYAAEATLRVVGFDAERAVGLMMRAGTVTIPVWYTIQGETRTVTLEDAQIRAVRVVDRRTALVEMVPRVVVENGVRPI